MFGVSIKKDIAHEVANNKIKDIKIRENIVDIPEEVKSMANQAMHNHYEKIARRSNVFLLTNMIEPTILSGSSMSDSEEFVDNYATADLNFTLNVITEDIPDEIAESTTESYYTNNDAVFIYNFHNTSPKSYEPASFFRHDSQMQIVSNIDAKAPYKSKKALFGVVRRACNMWSDSCLDYYTVPANTVKVEFGINNDFSFSSSKYAMMGSFNSVGRMDRGHHYRTDQNAWKDIVFSYCGNDKQSSLLKMIIPMNIDDDKLISYYQFMMHAYRTKDNTETLNDTNSNIEGVYIMNVLSYFMTKLFSNVNLNAVNLAGDLGKYVSRSIELIKSFSKQKKDYDPVINDEGFAYFEADNPLWRGTLYWPGGIVKNIAVYGSPFHLEISHTRTTFAMRRQINHDIIRLIKDVIMGNKPIASNPKVIDKSGYMMNMYDINGATTYNNFYYSESFIRSGANFFSSAASVLLYSLALCSMANQAVEPGKIKYASHYIKEKYLDKNFLEKVNRYNRMMSVLFGINFVFEDVDRFAEVSSKYSPQAAKLADTTIEKYFEKAKKSEELIARGIPVFNI